MSVLISSTVAFTVCFMVWMVFSVLGVPIKNQLGLDDAQFGLLAATPVLTGSLVRVPLGIWTDRYGGRIVLFILMLTTVIPIWMLSYATEFWHFIVLGLFVGLAGGSFSVGTPYVARWFPPRRQGMAMGVFGAGNSGSALTQIIAPWLIGLAGGAAVATAWTLVPKVYAVVMLLTAIGFWMFSAHNPAHLVPSNVKLSQQLALLKDPAVLRYCQYYSVVFGGYVGLSIWMTRYFIGEYDFKLQVAGLLAACFSWPGGVLRALGG
ncbi:MAG: NarK/NasA family nitrate transporter, partial [Ottowia sp.]|nr:NarK/NasA family nitrate transporter [Ottowia sp.]